MNREIRLNSLFSEYGEERFREWCRSLSIFRFFKSHPYPDDLAPDRFIALAKFNSREELLIILDKVKILFLEADIEQYLKHPDKKVISGNASIEGINCYVSINEVVGFLDIEVIGVEGDPFTLTADTFKRAKSIENHLEKLDIDFESSPHDDDYCISPEYYPDVWQ